MAAESSADDAWRPAAVASARSRSVVALGTAFPPPQEPLSKPSRSIKTSEGSSLCQHCATALADLDPMGPQRVLR